MRVQRNFGLSTINSQCLSTAPFGQRPNGAGSYTLYAIGFRFCFTPLAGVLFAFPSRYWFTIGCQVVFSLIRWSGRIHAKFHVHRITWGSPRGPLDFAHPAVTVYGQPFQVVELVLQSPTSRPRYPGRTSPPGLGCSAFARHYLRNHCHFLFLGLLRCFTSPRLASPDYKFIRSILALSPGGCPIRKSAGQSLFAAHRSLSQLSTSFIASWHQGIHRLLLVA